MGVGTAESHQPRETRGPIETLGDPERVDQLDRRHQPRETRGPIETTLEEIGGRPGSVSPPAARNARPY